ncbi:hypothetical protein IJI28_00985 [Candidatus Saccharibacteria bacterium]|nr:hypothetical protein [Candidatus Saccharibacteria bacterium]
MKKTISIKSIIAAVAGLIGMIATFLPWLSASAFGISVSAKGSDGDGWISFVCFAAVLSIAIVEMFKKAKWTKIVITVAAAIATIVVAIDMINGLNNGLTVNIGIYLGLVAGIAGIVVPWLPIDKNN